MASWIYQALYDCRNDFLHSDPGSRAKLILPFPQRKVFECAAPLNRLALTSSSRSSMPNPMPGADDAKAADACIAEDMEYMASQKAAEEALLTVTPPLFGPSRAA